MRNIFILISFSILINACGGGSNSPAGDQSAPIITLIGDNPLVIDLNSTFNDPGATVTDNLDTGLTATVSGTVDSSTIGTYTLNYNATDSSGNSATTVVRTIQVADRTAPIITLNGENPLLIGLNSTFNDPGATVTDNLDTGLTAMVSGTVNTSVTGEYILSYDATDSSGNTSTTINRTIQVASIQEPQNVGLTTSGKHLNIDWESSNLQDHFRILENPDGSSGFTLIPTASNISGNGTGFSLEIPVHKTNWSSALYIVESCNASETQCIAAPSQPLALTDSLAATFYLKASNTNNEDLFGWSVTISGDGNVMAIGAPGEASSATGINGDQADNSMAEAGAVYVFTRSGSTWIQQAYLKASNTDANDYFGMSVTLDQDGSTLAVGAYLEDSSATGIDGLQNDNSASQSGAVYVFTRSDVTWSQQAYIKASNTDNTGDFFGFAVILSDDGNTLAVGATGEASNDTGINGNESDNSLSGAGAVYVFTRSGVTWSQQAYIKASNTDIDDSFGASVTLSGDGNTIAVGANSEDSAATGIGGNQADNSVTSAGAVYVFTRNGATWNQHAYIKASNTGDRDLFGSSVTLSDDGTTLIVGASQEDSSTSGIGGDQADNSLGASGAVYVFSRSGSIWTQQFFVKASNPDLSDNFGLPVSLSGDGNTFAVGASLEDSATTGIGGNQTDNSKENSGSVYVFVRSGGVWIQENYVKAPNTDGSDNFGRAVALNDDGDTLAIGAFAEGSAATGIGGNQGNTGTRVGAVYVY